MTELYFPRASDPSPFVSGTLVQIVWDSTSIAWAKTCPRLYAYHMIEGYFPKDSGVHLFFGLVYHAALEAFDRARVAGADHDEATRQAVLTALKQTGSYELYASSDPAQCPPDAEYDELENVSRWTRWKPWVSPHSVKNRENLIRTIVWYTEHYKADPAPTVVLSSGQAAVEVSFKFEIPHEYHDGQSGYTYMLSGHLDKIVTFGEDNYVQDKKTTAHAINSYFFSNFDLSSQMTLYTIAGRVTFGLPIKGVMIDGAQITVGYSDFQRGLTTRTDQQLDEWLGDLTELFVRFEGYAKRDYWPMNDQACNNYVDKTGMGGCPFKSVCSRHPSQRESVLKTEFTRKRWNPLIPRTEDHSTR